MAKQHEAIRRRITVSVFWMLWIVIWMASGVQAAPRDGIDCNCTKTGTYVAASKGKAPDQGSAPAIVDLAGGSIGSPNGVYKVDVTVGGGYTSIRVTEVAGGALSFKDNLLSVNVIGSVQVGFSPDDDRFVYFWQGTETVNAFHVRIVDLTTGKVVKAYDMDVVSYTLMFSQKGNFLVVSWSTATAIYFRVLDVVTGKEVFTESTASDFQFGTTPWGFSPNGRYFLYHYVSGVANGQRHYVRLFDLESTGPVRTVAYDNPAGSAVLRFSPNSAYLLDAFATGTNTTTVQVRETVSGTLVYSSNFTFVSNPGNKGDKFKGAAWGFSPRSGNLVYAVDAGTSAVDLVLVNLATGEQVLLLTGVDVVSGFWRFSRCGDVMATVLQGSSGQLVANLYNTVNGSSPLYTQTSALTVSWQFRNMALNHEASVDGGPWQTTIPNTAPDACTPPLPDETPPVWGTGSSLSAKPGAPGSVSLSWSAATDADSGLSLYAIYQDGAEIGTTEAATRSFRITGLTSVTSYNFRVEAEDVKGNRSTNGPRIVFTTPDWDNPSWPPGAELVVSEYRDAATSLVLSWTPADDNMSVERYEVSVDAGGEGTVPVTGTFLSPTSFEVTGLVPGEDYEFYVNAVDSAGNTTLKRLSVRVNSDGLPPAWAGSSLRMDSADVTSTTVSWDAASDNVEIRDYFVYVDGVTIARLDDPTIRTFRLPCLLPDTSYTVWVEARDRAGNLSTDGPRLMVTTNTGMITGDGVTTRESVATDGSQGNNRSNSPVISDDGRFIVFSSLADNLVADDTNDTQDVFVRNLVTGVTERVSMDAGVEGNKFSSSFTRISADGRFVLFHSFSDNWQPSPEMVAAAAQGQAWIHDRQTGRSHLAVRGPSGEIPRNRFGPASVFPRDLSADGRMVLFSSDATNLVFDDLNGRRDIFLRTIVDRDQVPWQGNTVLVSVSASGVQANDVSFDADMSRDGRYVVFTSNATNLVDGGTNTTGGVYFKDMQTGQVELIAAGDGWSLLQPVVSDDGRFVAYTGSTNFEPYWSVFLYDRLSDTTVAISRDAGGNTVQGTQPAISAFGDFVAFSSISKDLLSHPSSIMEVFIFDRATETISRASVCSGGEAPSSGPSMSPQLTPDGAMIVFESAAPNLVPVPTDSNEVTDVFLHRPNTVAETGNGGDDGPDSGAGGVSTAEPGSGGGEGPAAESGSGGGGVSTAESGGSGGGGIFSLDSWSLLALALIALLMRRRI